MNVLIYASSASQQLSNALRSVLSPFYTVQIIVPGSLATQPWTASCALLVLSSDNPPAPLSLPRPAHEAIQDYVTAGGRILGVGLGASFLPHRSGRDRFDLWDARSSTATVPESPQDVSAHSPPSSILLRTGTSLSGLRSAGVPFELTRIASDNKVVHGHWEEPNGAVAGIQVPIGFGHAAFWGVSPYLDGIEDTASMLALLRYALTSLELLVPPETIPDGPLGPIVTPLPQFLLHPPGKRHITETVLRGLGLPNTTAESSDDSDLGVIKDTADTFHFHKVVTLEDAARLMAEARRVSASDTSSPHVATAMTDAPRVVVVLPPDVPPSRELTPEFDARQYFEVLASVRGDKLSDADNWGMGEALFYGEAVTSTQKMLDRNPQFLASLPTPIVSLATSQLSGRGRGSNTWLSPPGCLQFSILVRAQLRASPLPAHRLVFVQYLAGLAIVRACRDRRTLGAEAGARVRLKWPNDVYIDLPSSSGAGSERKKVGGILVNTSFSDGNVHVIVGCGIDVCTPAPVTALSLLSRPGERLDAETLLVLILTEFERLWNAFVAGQGSWAPFEEDYLDAWMHSDQLVTLTTVDPPIPVRIVGITHDHGLLRTIPERTGWYTSARHAAHDGYIDLQPDGNSFDIMMGLIKAKEGHS